MPKRYIKPRIVEITHPVIMFKLTKSYKTHMEDWKLYTAVRGQWKMDINKAKKFQYAFACDAGLVKEVYEIESWHKADDTMTEKELEFRKVNKLHVSQTDRIEFIGKKAPYEIRKKYCNTNVVKYWGKSQTQFKYIEQNDK